MNKSVNLFLLALCSVSFNLDAADKVMAQSEGNTLDEPPTYTKSISYPAQALNIPPNSSIIVPTSRGLSWANNLADSAKLSISRPTDWTGASPVTVKLWMQRTNNETGNVQFFARGRDFNPGDVDSDAPSVLSNLQTISGLRFRELTIEFPADHLLKAWWELSIQRNSTVTPAYIPAVTILSAELSYEAQLVPLGLLFKNGFE